jgi:serine/threonine protein kinase
MTLERGTHLHKRYRIVDILGQGGMGSVYRAVDENLGVDVAVKENLFTTEDYARQFRLEAVILASLRHPNLPRVSDHFVIGEQAQYLVMDFIEGEDLRQRMDRMGTIGDDDAILIGAAMCDALEYLHTRKPSILHRDVKPGNVKITPDGHIYLVDFGLAKVMQGTEATTTGARAMTPGYSPPEQYGTARTDPRTDVYSLGATLYAALTGIIPEDGLARAMDNAQLTPLRKHNSRVSRRLAAVIEKAMAVDPSDRYQRAEEFKQALLISKSKTEQGIGAYTVIPSPPASYHTEASNEAYTLEPRRDNGRVLTPSPEGEQPFVSPRKIQQERARRRTRGVIRFLLFLLALIIASAPFVSPDPMSILPANVRRMIPFLIATSSSTPPLTSGPVVIAGVSATPTLTPATQPATNKTPIVLTESVPSTPTEIGTPVVVPAPNATPMGGGFGQVAFASNRTGLPQIYLTDLAGKTVSQITNMTGGACQPSWSPDGMKLVFTSPCKGREDMYTDASLYLINVDGSNLPPTPLPAVPGGDFDPAWSPDGTRIAFTSMRSRKMEIYVFNLADQSVTQLTNHASIDMQSRQPAWSPDGKQIAYTVKRFGVYQIWLMTAEGKNQMQIVRPGAKYSDYLPTWSPDGKLILFNQRCVVSYCPPYVRSISGVDHTTLESAPVELGPRPIEDVIFSSDGFWILYEGEDVGENIEIAYVTVNGANRTFITRDAGLDFDPAWRPNAHP